MKDNVSNSCEPDGNDAVSQPGSRRMPRWNSGELPIPPTFSWKNWFALLGPGIIMGGTAIGGGEWLMGPAVTARYGAALMWLVTCSILFQVVYNLEISRYTLYTGEPIFTGKFRTPPGPHVWLLVYFLLDFGTLFPYLAANAATPVAAIFLGEIPDSANPEHRALLQWLGYGIFILAFVPLIFGGKVYRSLKVLMSVKIVVVLGFLLVVMLGFTSPKHWLAILSGFVQFGNVPVQVAEDRNGNGLLDPGEHDWDEDGRADVVEPMFQPLIADDGNPEGFDLNHDGLADSFVRIDEGESAFLGWWPDLNQDSIPDPLVQIDMNRDGQIDWEASFSASENSPVNEVAFVFLDTQGKGRRDVLFLDVDGDGTRDGDGVENVFTTLAKEGRWPEIDLSMIAFLAAFVAIAGSGGLVNTAISNHTRDHGWGMGKHVGAIPSAVGGRDLKLSHVGSVFRVTEESRNRFKRWYRHVMRDQLAVWMPACFLGVALPSLLSIAFLKRGTYADKWTAAGMTADGVQAHVSAAAGTWMGQAFWFMTLLCGFLVLAPSMSSIIDGFVRRWVDVSWTASGHLRRWPVERIRQLYFGVLIGYGILGLMLLSVAKPVTLVLIATNLKNFALGFSCWHTVYVNRLLLPSELRAPWGTTAILVLGGCFFWCLATLTALLAFGIVG